MSDAVHLRSAVIVSSDRAYHGEYVDLAGPAAMEWLSAHHYFPQKKVVVPDDRDRIKTCVEKLLLQSDLVVVSGGTGLGPKDLSPQAVTEVADYEIPGIGELLRAESLKFSLNAYISRCGGFVKNQKLILVLPGNPKAVVEQLNILKDVIRPAICALRGSCDHRRRTQAGAGG
jgi:molybdenum cofactor biosynthesis protein B